MYKSKLFLMVVLIITSLSGFAQDKRGIVSYSASSPSEIENVMDGNQKTGWTLSNRSGKAEWMFLGVDEPSNIAGVMLCFGKVPNADALKDVVSVQVSYDPMNMGNNIPLNIEKRKDGLYLAFNEDKYGAHVNVAFDVQKLKTSLNLKGVEIYSNERKYLTRKGDHATQKYMDPSVPVEERVEALLSVMTPEDKMELLREGWGIPGIPHLYVPPITKVEAVHGFSYGSGATVYPQAIGMGATFNKTLTGMVATAIGEETVAAGTLQAWSPVLDVAQDPRWGRCEETYGEDPYLVSQIGGAWIGGYQSCGLFTTPKHFGGHGAPLGGRDSHDIGLSEREFREVHLVPFRHVIRNLHCQSLMMAYSDYQGVPVAKNRTLLNQILRQEWGFDGFIVSDCGAIGNLTSKKHYTAQDKVEAARQALHAGIATNCGDTYNDKAVIEAAKNGDLNMDDLDEVCRSMLRMMFRNELFEQPAKPKLDWKKVYSGWNSPSHREIARQAARESIVLLENKESILPLSKGQKKVALIGPGVKTPQMGDYTPDNDTAQYVSVYKGVEEALGNKVQLLYQKGCSFTKKDADIANAVSTAKKSDVVIMVLGDNTDSNRSAKDEIKTSGENHDYATLQLPGQQMDLLEAVAATGKPVVVVLQIGRPYVLTRVKELASAILVNWFPGQEGGYATADVLFGDYNPAGRLPMTFPRHVGQLPLYYNFKTSGRRYEYADMEFYPLYPFGYGLSYTDFNYSDLNTKINEDGTVDVDVNITNTGKKDGDEVAQLYVTDMYASVKTRVTQLKGFERVHLAAGETKNVKFRLEPYDLSLLNDNMDRVVEKGEFKILVGGRSPEYVAKDQIKDSMHYSSAKEGLSTMIDYDKSFAADFNYNVDRVQKDIKHDCMDYYLNVVNNGNLMDVDIINTYVDGKKYGEETHVELGQNENKVVKISVPTNGDVTFVTKKKVINTNKN